MIWDLGISLSLIAACEIFSKFPVLIFFAGNGFEIPAQAGFAHSQWKENLSIHIIEVFAMF